MLRKSIMSILLAATTFIAAYFGQAIFGNEMKEEEGDFVRKREEWFYQQRAFGLGYIPAGAREAALEKMEREMPVYSFSKRDGALGAWTQIGPTNIAGRITSIAIDPNNPSTMWFTAADGGVWKTTNGGTSWSPIADNLETLTSGLVAYDGKNKVLYFANGEAHNSLDSYGGTGVYKSTDGGASWAKLDSVPTISIAGQTGPTYYYTSVLTVDTIKNRVWLGFLTRRQGSRGANGALYKSTNGGISWTRINQTGGPLQFPFLSDFVLNPVNTDLGYAAVGYVAGSLSASGFSEQGIYKTSDGGNNWTGVTNGLPPASEMGRINLAISRSNPSVLYASIIWPTSNSTNGGKLRGLYKTTDGGSSWTQLTATPNYVGNQGFYNNILTVDPTNPNVIFAGGIDIYKSTNGGSGWINLTDFYSSNGPLTAGHPDQHALVFHPNNPSTIYSGSDGGLYYSFDGGSNWTSLNNGVATTQFYSIALNPRNRNKTHGGTQDNGTLKYNGTTNWTTILVGDGGSVGVDFFSPETLYTVYVYLEMYRSFNGGLTFNKIVNGISRDLTTERIAFYAPYDVSKSSPAIMYSGTYKMWRSTNRGTSWGAVSGDLTSGTGTISAITIAPSDPNHVYVGTSDGALWSTSNGGLTWDSTANHPLDLVGNGRRFVKDFAVYPSNPAIAYVTFSGYNTSHVFKTTDHGVTWMDISSGVPDVPVNAIVLHPKAPSTILFIATDIGCMVSTNSGTSWGALGSGLPNVVVHDIAIAEDGSYVRAATHGRSVWELTDVPTSVAEESPFNVIQSYQLYQNYPNPFNPSTTIKFALPTAEHITLKIFDATGREVKTLIDDELGAGHHVVRWNGTDALQQPVSSGTYFYRLHTASYSGTNKMILLR